MIRAPRPVGSDVQAALAACNFDDFTTMSKDIVVGARVDLNGGQFSASALK